MMLVGMTPSTHEGRRKLLTEGVDGGELTGEIVTRSGADPLRFDAATDTAAPNPSSSAGFPPDVSPGRVEESDLYVKQSSRQWFFVKSVLDTFLYVRNFLSFLIVLTKAKIYMFDNLFRQKVFKTVSCH